MVRDIHLGDIVHFNFWSDKRTMIHMVDEGEGLYYLTVDESFNSVDKYCISLYLSDKSKVSRIGNEQPSEYNWLLSFDVDKTLAQITFMSGVLRYAVELLKLSFIYKLFGDDKAVFSYNNVTDKGIAVHALPYDIVKDSFFKTGENWIEASNFYVSEKGLDAVEKANYVELEIQHINAKNNKQVFLRDSTNISRELVLLDNRYTEADNEKGFKHERFLLLKDESLGLLSMVSLGTNDDKFVWNALINYHADEELKTLLDVRNSKLNVLYSITIDLHTFNHFNIEYFDALSNDEFDYYTLVDYLLTIENELEVLDKEKFSHFPTGSYLYLSSIFGSDFVSKNGDGRILDRKIGLSDLI